MGVGPGTDGESTVSSLILGTRRLDLERAFSWGGEYEACIASFKELLSLLGGFSGGSCVGCIDTAVFQKVLSSLSVVELYNILIEIQFGSLSFEAWRLSEQIGLFNCLEFSSPE